MLKMDAALLCLLAVSQFASAAVSNLEIIKTSDVAGGITFGKAGAYECIEAKVHFAVDPKLAPNRIIADLDLAPRNAQGMVEFAADLYMLRPRDPASGNGTALLEISNRGGKALPSEFNFAGGAVNPLVAQSLGDGFLLNQGFTLVWVGWEFDLPEKPDLLRAYLPIASEDGKPITGIVRSEWTGDQRQDMISLGDRGQTGYAVVDAASPENKLFVRDSVLGKRIQISRDEWRFADARHAALNGGFAPGRIYEVVYGAKDPPVAGLGLAAVRDFASYLKYGGAPTAISDEHMALKRVIAFGVSQSGRFLREFLFDGFNQDEQMRQVFDGVWAHVAGAGRGSFNQRFAQPSRDGHAFVNVFYPVDVPPFDEEQLLTNARRGHVVPKLFLTNGSYEYWGRCASLIHTTLDGKADAPPLAGVRIYFFAGSQHTVGSIPPHAAPAQNLTNTNDYRYALRALLIAMQAWLVNGKEPPGSRYPRIEEEQLTSIWSLDFPRVPGARVPQHKREAYRLDFSTEPPAVGPAYPTSVPQVDDDGNEAGGIRMPEIAVPLASYTGWNLRSAAIGAPSEPIAFLGSWIPFAKTRRERLASGDARRSIEERYANEHDYLTQIDSAARELVAEGFLLPQDLRLVHERAASEWDYRQCLP
jgi:hypothetical protein